MRRINFGPSLKLWWCCVWHRRHYVKISTTIPSQFQAFVCRKIDREVEKIERLLESKINIQTWTQWRWLRATCIESLLPFRLVLEYPATGGCFPYSIFRTLKLLRYVSTMDYFVMACEILFVIYLIYYTIEEMIEIKRHKMEYFKSFWNILDIVVIVMGVVCIVFNLYRTFEVSSLLEGLLGDTNKYANFEVLGYWQQIFNDFIAIAVFVAWIKVCRNRSKHAKSFKVRYRNSRTTALHYILQALLKRLCCWFWMVLLPAQLGIVTDFRFQYYAHLNELFIIPP